MFATLGLSVALVLIQSALYVIGGPQACQPIEEGGSLSVDCDGANHQDISAVVWTKTSPSGEETPISLCPVGEEHCRDDDPQHFKTHRNLTALTSHSKMYASNLNRSHHDHKLSCKSQTNRTLSQCTVDIYKKPRVPTCRATKVDEHTVYVTCSTRDVFPDLRCSITEMEDQTHSTRTWSENQLIYKSDSSEHYCEYQADVPLAGTYFYLAIMWPKTKQVSKRAISVPTRISNSVKIFSSLANARLRQETLISRFCLEGSKDIEIIGDVFGFPSEPNIIWTKNGQSVSYQNSTISPILDGEDIAMFTIILILRVSELDDGQDFTLAAGIKSLTGDRYVKVSGLLELQWPPRENPRFLDFSNERTPDTVEVNVKGGLKTFHCHIPGGKPIVKQTHVKCSSTDNNITVQEFSTSGNLLSFAVEGKAGEKWACHCTGHHVTGRECYTGKSTLSIHFFSGNEETSATSGVALAIGLLIGFFFVMVLTLGLWIYLGKRNPRCKSLNHKEHSVELTSQLTESNYSEIDHIYGKINI